MRISKFTQPELDVFRKECNFVNLEIDIFELRAKGYTLTEISEKLNISEQWCRKISGRVNKKINKIINKQ